MSYVTSVVIADRCQITLFIQSIVIFRRSGLTIPAHIRLWSVDDAAERCGWSINDDSVSRTSNFISCSDCEHKQQRIRSRHCIEPDKFAFLNYFDVCPVVFDFSAWCCCSGSITATSPIHHPTLLVVPRHQLSSYGRRAFCVAGPSLWNSLPDSLRDPVICGNIFRQSLKTFLFATYWCIQRIMFRDYINRLFTYILTYLSSPRLLVVSTFATVKAGLITKCCGRGPRSVRSSNN